MSIFLVLKWLYFFINVGLVLRLYVALRGTGAVRVLVCSLAIAASLIFPFLRTGIEGNGLGARVLTFIGTFWLSFVLHTLIAWALVGIFCFLNGRFHWLVISPENLPRWRYAACAGIAATAALLSFAGWVNTQLPVVREVKLAAPAGAAPFRIVALSDTHLGRLVSPAYFSSLVDLIEPLTPDLVLFAGDIIDDYDGYDAAAIHASLQRLAPRFGVWAALGNHEYIAGDPLRSRDLLEKSGIRVLRDQGVELGEGKEKILLVGRDDRSIERFLKQPRKPLSAILAAFPNAASTPMKILIDHQPFHLEEAQEAGFYLQLSGHTHNGQIFPFNFIVGHLYENAHGYSRRGATHYWVSSGAGTWGPRIRTTGRTEILAIDIVPETAN
ncbi:MAG: metallophosphoesterase [Azoarcus sp.]|jgi:predicted MPP superfamily phosphohydrolase|nr:metallophosphoesterase [Azoarcus sp.]